jgi:hypothetical protein
MSLCSHSFVLKSLSTLLATEVVNFVTLYRIATGNRMFFKKFVFQSAAAAAAAAI